MQFLTGRVGYDGRVVINVCDLHCHLCHPSPWGGCIIHSLHLQYHMQHPDQQNMNTIA